MAVRIALSKLKGDLSQYAVTVKTDNAGVIGFLTQGHKPRTQLPLIEELLEIIAQCGSFTVEKIVGKTNPAHSLAREGVRKSTGILDATDPFASIPGVEMRSKRQRSILLPGEVRQVRRAMQTEVREHRTGSGKTEQVVCGKCSGSGAFGNYGVCYRCKGKGYQDVSDRRRNWGYDKFRSEAAQ
jgi:hypothetical protein